MREIKFRFWNTLTGKFEEDSDLFFIRGDGVICSNYSVENNLEAEQYTGLKDKNDKEIYEGDILKSDDRNDLKYYPTLTAVKWSDINSGFIPFADYDGDCNIWYDEKYCEVIGNIHENPELLEQGNAKN